MTPISDAQLMHDVRAGRTASLATLFDRHHKRLYRFCLRMTGDRHAAEDLVQDVFMKMLKYRRSFRGTTSFSAWMFRIARNACVDHLRRWDTVPADPAQVEEATDGDDVERRAADDARAALVRRALMRLPVPVREVLVLSRFEFKTYEEIARVLNCSVGAVKVRAHRAIKELRLAYLELSQEGGR